MTVSYSTFQAMLKMNILDEELHKEIQGILNEPENDRESRPGAKLAQDKFNRVTKKVRELSKRGEDTGLQDGKPKKGSSRAVFFPSEHKEITVDGKTAKHPTVVKVAFHGTLDPHTGDSRLLGEHQNEVEADNYHQREHSTLIPNHDGSYTHNPHGILAPVLDHHPDHHWIEMSHVDNMSGSKFTQLTKTPEHPKGLKHAEFKRALENDWDAAHGRHSGEDGLDHVRSHPFYEAVQDHMYSSDMQPHDLDLRNMGSWKHPVTGKEQPVIRDYGFNKNIAKLYTQARKNKYKW